MLGKRQKSWLKPHKRYYEKKSFTTEAPPSHLRVESEGSSSEESEGEEVNLMMRSLMKHKSEEKKENKRLKLEHQASSNFYQSQVLSQRKALIELLTPHPSSWTLSNFLPPLYHSLASHPVHFPAGLEPVRSLLQGIYCTTTFSDSLNSLLYLRSQGHIITVMPLNQIDLHEPKTELSID